MKSLNGAAAVAAWSALAVGGVAADAVAQTTWTVCQDGSCDFSEIQAAIDASTSGDTVFIAAGTYAPANTLSNGGKDVHLLGSIDVGGNPLTILDGGNKQQLLALSGTAATVENIVFRAGRSSAGGAMTIGTGCAAQIVNCHFVNNYATQFGGGVHTYQAAPTFIRCRFHGNTAIINGGGLYPVGSNSTFIECVISGNTAPNGSGMFLAGNCFCHTELFATVVCENINTSTSLSQVFPAGNNTWSADAASCINATCSACTPVEWKVAEGGNGHWYRYVDLADTWTNWSAAAAQLGGYLATVTTSAEAAFIGEAFPSSLRFHLGGYQDLGDGSYSEPGGGWKWVTGELWSYAAWGPGEPNNLGGAENFLERVGGAWNDIPDYPRNALVEFSADCNGDGIVDYGQILDGTFEDANANGVPDCCEDGIGCDPCPGDVNFDGIVNGADISVLLGFWGLNGKPNNADINGDGIVNGADLAYVLGNWGPCQ